LKIGVATRRHESESWIDVERAPRARGDERGVDEQNGVNASCATTTSSVRATGAMRTRMDFGIP
jgi:hypothetical protein